MTGAEQELLEGLAGGNAVLILGQDHSAGLSAEQGRDIAALLGNAPGESTQEQLVNLTEPAKLHTIRPAFARNPTDDLLLTAGNPWAMVLTSAVDPVVIQALQQTGGVGRRIRVLYAGEFATLGRSQPSNPTVVRLYGSVDEVEPRRLPPLTRADLLRRQRLEVVGIMSELPRLVGPRGLLICAGISDQDWISLQDLALACVDLPPGRVHWFPAFDNPADVTQVSSLLPDQLVVWEEPFPTTLESLAGQPEAEVLEGARVDIFQPVARTISLRRADGRATQIRLSPEELRTLARFSNVLYDGVDDPYDFTDRSERRQAFRDFLHRVQRLPDWRGVSSGFLFEREVASEAADQLDRELRNLGSIHAASNGGSGNVRIRASRLPYLIEGPPASGKTRLLHWLAVELRRRGHPVVFALPGSGRIYFEQLARACAILETKTIELKSPQPIALVIDGLDADEYSSLSEFLASVGRNVLVLGTRNRLASPDLAVGVREDVPPTAGDPAFKGIPISSFLTPEEIGRFNEYLKAQGFDELAVPAQRLNTNYFLLFLYRLLPDARGNIQLAISEEYERLLRGLDQIAAASTPPSDWQTQLEKVRRQLFPDMTEGPEAERVESAFAHDPAARQAVAIALFCSQIEEPISIDLLIRTVGGGLLRHYRAFSEAIRSTALLQETELDAEGSIGLVAEHPFLAKVALKPNVPNPAEQVKLLDPVTSAIHWDPHAFPGENADQDYMLNVLRSIAPRGKAEGEFDSVPALTAITELLRGIREVHGANIPRLLLLEANTLRILAGRDADNPQAASKRYEEAIHILGEAEAILNNRRATPARNFELANIATTLAAVYGYLITSTLREYQDSVEEEQARIRNRVLEYLEQVDFYTLRSRSLGSTDFHPLDVDFWAYRDVLERLPDVSDVEKTQMLARLETILEAASEEPLAPTQQERYQKRVVNLAELREDFDLSEELAREMAEAGNYGGISLLARSRVFDPASREAVSREAAREGLAFLEEFAPGVFSSPEATALMHRLWMSAFLPTWQLSGETPILAACERDIWTRWRRILEARLGFPEAQSNPYLNFCLAWCLLQLDEPAKAVSLLREIEPLTTGNRRRVGALAVISDESGAPIDFTGLVRRKDTAGTVVYVPRLTSEVFFSRALEAQHHPGVQVGDEVRFHVGLNYRSLTPWYPPPARRVTRAESG